MWNKDPMWNKEPVAPSRDAAKEPRFTPKPKTIGEEARSMACIGKSVVVKGEVVSSEDLIVDGHVEGRVDLQGHSLTVGPGGSIRAEIAAKSVNIEGSVIGNVTATEKVQVLDTGSVEGDIVAPRIAVSEGAVLRGRIDAGPKHAEKHADKHADKEQRTQQQFPVAV